MSALELKEATKALSGNSARAKRRVRVFFQCVPAPAVVPPLGAATPFLGMPLL